MKILRIVFGKATPSALNVKVEIIVRVPFDPNDAVYHCVNQVCNAVTDNNIREGDLIEIIDEGGRERRIAAATSQEDHLKGKVVTNLRCSEGEVTYNEAALTLLYHRKVEQTPPAPEADTEDKGEFIVEHMTEAAVFAKYGLVEKAAEHLGTILARYPDEEEVWKQLEGFIALSCGGIDSINAIVTLVLAKDSTNKHALDLQERLAS